MLDPIFRQILSSVAPAPARPCIICGTPTPKPLDVVSGWPVCSEACLEEVKLFEADQQATQWEDRDSD